MEKPQQHYERETHDFMNVDSFSQLPFIRPPPPPASPREKGGPIRLFGIEFGADLAATEAEEEASGSTNEDAKDNDRTEESNRKFECHYCCRNFPTSQALGGHQNAHKRERQHAKRAHLQAVMAHSGALPTSHMYGLMNYRLMGSAVPMAYAGLPHWSSRGSSAPHQQSTPITGNPLGFWRMPAAQNASTPHLSFNRSRSFPSSVPLFAAAGSGGNSGVSFTPPPQLVSGSNFHSRYVYEPKPSVQDSVSLDLHL